MSDGPGEAPQHVSLEPQHVSLEAQFRAVVPEQRTPLRRRLLWRLMLRLLALRPVQKYIEKKYPA